MSAGLIIGLIFGGLILLFVGFFMLALWQVTLTCTVIGFLLAGHDGAMFGLVVAGVIAGIFGLISTANS